MNPAAIQRLIALNQEFYDRFGASFAATRHRLQPGVQRILDGLRGNESVLDLGCGNGELARALSTRGFRGRYLGLDFSAVLLRDAERQPLAFRAHFMQAQLTELVDISKSQNSALAAVLPASSFDAVYAFAVLHHVPSLELRIGLARAVRSLLKPDGSFTLSNWQYLNSRKLAARVQPWASAGLHDSDVDEGDHLLDWRGGGTGLRYVHHFSEAELGRLAELSGFQVRQTFYSDGMGGRLGLYQVWTKAVEEPAAP